MRACVTTSRPVVGSSSTTSRGSQTSADGDGDALLLAAGELMREAAREAPVGREVDAAERREHAVAARGARHVRAQHVGHRVADAQRRG